MEYNSEHISNSQEEKIYHYSDKIEYDKSSLQNAMYCIKNMQELEDIPNFGKLIYKSPSDIKSRYYIEEYKDKIDMTFYTDMATSTLSYTIWFLSNQFGEKYDSDIFNYCYKYAVEGSHDLINDSTGEFANFEGDDSLFEGLENVLEPFKIYAYYNEFELITGDEKEDISNLLTAQDIENEIIVKKTESIDGTDMDFYYVGDNYFEMSEQLIQHDYNIRFFNERMPGSILNAIVSKYEKNDIITVTADYSSQMIQDSPNWAAYADIKDGHIVVRNSYFTEVICHETGHLFDKVNIVELFGDSYLTTDYTNYIEIGHWDVLAEKYADDIELIRKGAEIGCGYESDDMRRMHYEFYAEAFQLYFYSEETRAALPEAVRKRIEIEIKRNT